MNTFKTAQISRIGLFTALTIVMSQISIPMPYGVPMTMQTFIIPLVALLLGKKEGTLVSIIYIILGMIGLPVFAGFTGGLGIVLGPTGGFILSFPLLAICAGIASQKKNKSSVFLWLLTGSLLNFLVGMLYFSLMTSNSLWVAFTACVLPFIPTTLIKIGFIMLVGKKLQNLMLKKLPN
ncbi:MULTISPECIES: biotin transporter BioY [Vagococcus]|uniref:Biotin transporter n=1 Tax=Vagococcus fluvialis bH819 TaxID=1255619 RepID=A0A1X6WKB3_9ENTE|nr:MULTISPECIES: biotin transporter BioY [Vagococcus]SLM84682.1 Substrate-specific component BioY of biotin ECF transporter [Vagococcus fluvialis bH819]HCM89854.1 biotin transporter BioY [Vagococcus sp.]